MTLKELKAKRAELHQQFKDAVAAVEKAEDKKAARQKATDLKAQYDEVTEDIALLEAEQEQARALAAGAATGADQRTARRGQVELGVNHRDEDPKKGFRDHKHFLSEVMTAGRTGKVSELLKPLQAVQGSDEQSVESDPHGGFLVPHGVAPGILSIEPEGDPLSGRITDVPLSMPSVSFNARVDKNHTTSVSGGFVVTRRPETVDGSSSRMKFEQIDMIANEEYGLAFATERILRDSPESFVAIIAAGFNDEFIANAMRERLNGSGVGERLGILNTNNGCLISIAKEPGQAAGTILTENIDKMVARCWRYGRAVWLANQDTFPQLMGLKREVGTGGSTVNYLQVAGDSMTLLGRPLFMTEFAKSIGNVGDLILGVWSEYLEGTYQQMESAESIHVRFAANERAFRFYRRNDGRPWWRTVLTPAESSSTLSPFVTIAAR